MNNRNRALPSVVNLSESTNPNPNPFSVLDGFEEGDDADSVKFPEDTGSYVPNNSLRKSIQSTMTVFYSFSFYLIRWYYFRMHGIQTNIYRNRASDSLNTESETGLG